MAEKGGYFQATSIREAGSLISGGRIETGRVRLPRPFRSPTALAPQKCWRKLLHRSLGHWTDPSVIQRFAFSRPLILGPVETQEALQVVEAYG